MTGFAVKLTAWLLLFSIPFLTVLVADWSLGLVLGEKVLSPNLPVSSAVRYTTDEFDII